MDDIVRREITNGWEGKRAPDYKNRVIFDETAVRFRHLRRCGSTMMGAIKFLSENQRAQSQLRTSLRDAFVTATKESRKLLIQEITSTRIPYLDAVSEEIFRMAGTIPSHVRTATEDTVVLGHVIPKGTDVLLSINGPGFTSPGFTIDENKRTESCRSTKGEKKQWDMDMFCLERWLVKSGKECVDRGAAPQMLFSLGPRGCFGKRSGQLNVRVLLVLLMWHFKFLPLPDELISDGIENFICRPRARICSVGKRTLMN
ncbi:cytochrome P450 [Talaromyces proteolyticus]|uniref:Cytochrome P450 n=1 Tax=Talaromyces proteolyticus TaxID=1131652 RepID=A0AAD4PVW1_9EURO|nr:cytochrome P450 [Talaromyces proteolyticus]KAH8693937.1 cytochrome P450 [Talaromyces proteolyticus]